MRLATVVAVAASLLAIAAAAAPLNKSETFAAKDHRWVASGGSGSVELQAQDRDGNEPDITEMVLLTLAVAGGAAVLSLIGYVIRQRVGFWLHRPPPRDGSAPEEHH